MAGSRGGLGRVVAMASVLAAGLLLALAGTARAQEPLTPIGFAVAGGDEWRAANDFEVLWTNPPEWQVGGASWRLIGPGFVGPAAFAPGVGLSQLDHLRVPAAGRWELAVWLRDPSGWELPSWAATATLRLDDVAPTVAFMPGDATALSPQLVAAVADPLSGVADGTISYRRLDQERWADLPTQIRVGALGTELAAATPELKPGTAYAFRAEARDGAGNVGTTTMRADGAPMQFRQPDAPADQGASHGSAGGRAGGSGGRHGSGAAADGEARRTRLLVGLAAGRGRGRTALTVGPGDAAVLRGLLAGSGGGLDGQPLRVVTRPARGARGGVRVESLTTGPGGRFELRLAPGPSRRLAVAFAGGEGLRPARRRLALRVRGAVSLHAAPSRLATGGLLRLEGRVGAAGARIPRSGKLVTISYWEREARRWRPAIVTRSDRGGRFRASYRFRYVTGRARIRLRATAPAEADWPYAPGSSRPLTVEVRG
jgi:hypothetical protein